MGTDAVHAAVLGPVAVRVDGADVELGAEKLRAVIAALALARGRAVAVDAIVDLLWGDHPPPGVTTTLQAYISQLRKVLEPSRERRAPATVLVTVAPGYALRLAPENLDAARFETTVNRIHAQLKALTPTAASPLASEVLQSAVEDLDTVLALWRGEPFGELGDAPSAVAERGRLEELRLIALEDRAVARLALGHHSTVAAELEALTSAYPLRERLWGLQALALARAGRQADALDVLQRVRKLLDAELGLEPSAELRELQTALLRQDKALDWVAPVSRTPAPPVAPQPLAEPPAPEPQSTFPWPLAGRDAELAELVDALDSAIGGTPRCAVITGEPGIGKSRLAAELSVVARARGMRILRGRGSQDDGAPPLWPWHSVLEGLGLDLPEVAGDDTGAAFRGWERICGQVAASAALTPLLIVLDDLHWADTSTLRVLRLLVESTTAARLFVVCTWRPHPTPTGALADVAETLARAHAVRLELTGLAAESVADLFTAVSGSDLSPVQADDLRSRTEGNPFFLVEYARLAGSRKNAAEVLLGDHLPTAVSEVVTRRVSRLPAETVTALRSAAIVGREFDLPTLASVLGADEDDLLDVIEPAQAAGLVRENGIDHFLFAHALVRDNLLADLTVSRRARAHARVARVLDGRRGRETEVARHWLASGPWYAAQAWRAAVTAAAVARKVHAYDDAASLLQDALTAQRDDQSATLQDRYDVLLLLIDNYRWAALLPPLVETVEAAIDAAKLLDPDVATEAVTRAAIATSESVLWRSAPPGEVNEKVVAALRGSLDRLPETDSPLRSMAMLALANELGEEISLQERRALVDEGIAMARRLGDGKLILEACAIGFVALWLPGTAPERLEWAQEAARTAQQIGDERGFVVAATLRAIALSELGRPTEMFEAVRTARAEAERLRILFGEMMLDSLELPWLAMAGRLEECHDMIERMQTRGRHLSHNDADVAVVAALTSLRLHEGRGAEAVPVLQEFDSVSTPMSASVAVYLWRSGEHEQARKYFAEHGAPLEHENQASLLAWCHAAEIALYLGQDGIGAAAYDKLAPYAGWNCAVGSALASGPVDCYLACAAAAAGEKDLAARHAEDGLRLARGWGLADLEKWFTQTRADYDF